MRNEDLLALAALAGGVAAFKNKADKDYAELPEQKEVAARRRTKYDKMAEDLGYPVSKNKMSARHGGRDPLAVSVDTVSEKEKEAASARRKAASEELNLKNTGRRKTPMVDSSGNPITTRYGGYAHTEGMKKGGKVSSASSRADGIAQKGKTKGRMI